MYDMILNLTGRRIDIALRTGKRLSIEPSHRVARLCRDPKHKIESVIKVDDYEIDLTELGDTMVENLPNPKAGVLYIVKSEVAQHPKVRRRSDVVYALTPGGGTATGLTRG